MLIISTIEIKYFVIDMLPMGFPKQTLYSIKFNIYYEIDYFQKLIH